MSTTRTPEQSRKYAKEWREKNLEWRRSKEREYYQKNREKLLAHRKAERERNRERYVPWNAEYRAKNKRSLADKQRCRTYGITIEQLYRMLEEQGNACASCRDKFDENLRSQHIDHCHRTGKVRGVLCHNCNIALGNAKDSIERLRGLISSLEKNG